MNRQRRIATRPAQHHFPATHHAHDRVVHGPHDGAIVNQEKVGDAGETQKRILFVDADRLVAEIPTGRDDGKTEIAQEKM